MTAGCVYDGKKSTSMKKEIDDSHDSTIGYYEYERDGYLFRGLLSPENDTVHQIVLDENNNLIESTGNYYLYMAGWKTKHKDSLKISVASLEIPGLERNVQVFFKDGSKEAKPEGYYYVDKDLFNVNLAIDSADQTKIMFVCMMYKDIKLDSVFYYDCSNGVRISEIGVNKIP